MKIKFNKKEFLKAIKVGGAFSGNKKILPILECVKITIKNNTCWIMSYDNINAIKVHCKYEECEGDIVFCINKNDIETYVSLLEDNTFIIDVNNESLSAVVETENTRMDFMIEDSKYYPQLVQECNSDSFEINADLLSYWIQRGAPFLYNDDLQLNHQNMHFIIKDNKIDVFCFGYTKMYHDSSDIEFNGELSMSIDRNSFSGIRYALDNEDTVTIKDGEKNTMILGSHTMVLIRKDDFKMHNFKQLLGYKPLFEIEADKAKLMSVVNRALSIHNNSDMGTFTINYEHNKLTITSENIEMQKKFRETMDIESKSDFSGFEQTYTINLFKTALNAINSEKILLRPTGETSLLSFNNPEYATESSFIMPCKKD